MYLEIHESGEQVLFYGFPPMYLSNYVHYYLASCNEFLEVLTRNLEANKFSGTVPAELGKLTNLQTL